MGNETSGLNVGTDEIIGFDTDGTLAGNSDLHVPSQKAVKAYVDGHATAAVDTDGTMAANSDVVVPSQKAVRTYTATNFTKAPVAAPSTASSAGVAGTWAYDATHIYVCIATNTWVRATLATW